MEKILRDTIRKCEKKLFKATVESLLDAGFLLSIDNGGETLEFEPTTDKKKIIRESYATDQELLVPFDINGNQVGWVQFVYGNCGWDVISDYTTNLETYLEPVNKLADELEAKYF